MIKKLINFFTSLVLVFVPLLTLVPSVYAAADTCTWTGGGGDDNFSTAANWSGCDNGTVPESGDSLTFDNTGLSAVQTVANDLVGASFNTLSFTGTDTDNFFNVTGNDFSLTGGISNTSGSIPTIGNVVTLGANQTFSGPITIGSALSPPAFNLSTYTLTLDVAAQDCYGQTLYIDIAGSGSIIKNGLGAVNLGGDNSFTGSVSLNSGVLEIQQVSGLGTTAAGTTVSSGARLGLNVGAGTDATVAEPLTLAGDGISGSGAVTDYGFGCYGGGGTETPPTITLSGNTTLTANTLFAAYLYNFKLTGALSGAYTLTLKNGSVGSLLVQASSNTSSTPNGTISPAAFTTTYSTNSPSTDVNVANKETVIVTGTVGSVYIPVNGILKGTGTVGAVTLAGGTLAPGLSPGILNTGNLAFTGGTFEAELGGTASGEYDQTNVTGTVALGTTTTLNTSLYNGFKPVAGNAFTIINNDAADAVTGTFTNLAEGATFTVDGYVLKISYVGGDGNDVVLTVQSVPSTPDTGFKLLSSNPIITLFTTTMLAIGIALIARRYNTTISKNN